MAVESTAQYINQLNANYPQPNDFISEGDDHIRLIKQVLKNTFPTPTGGGDQRLTADYTSLNKIPNHFKFSTSGATKTIDLHGNQANGSRVIGVVSSTDPTAATSYQQVQDMIASALEDKIFRIGCYWLTDHPTETPMAMLGFGQWVKVAGFLCGSGVVPPSGSFPNQQNTSFTVPPMTNIPTENRVQGGNATILLSAGQIPQLSADLGQYYTATDGDHYHLFGGDDGIATGGYTIASNFNYDADSSGGGDAHNYRTKSANPGTAHRHRLSGTFHIGAASPSFVNVLPPYRVTHVWRRIS